MVGALLFLLTITCIGLSLFIAEVILGKEGRNDVVSTFEKLAPKNGHIWRYAGFMIMTSVLILSFYTIVVVWIMKYIVTSIIALPTSQFIYFNATSYFDSCSTIM